LQEIFCFILSSELVVSFFYLAGIFFCFTTLTNSGAVEINVSTSQSHYHSDRPSASSHISSVYATCYISSVRSFITITSLQYTLPSKTVVSIHQENLLKFTGYGSPGNAKCLERKINWTQKRNKILWRQGRSGTLGVRVIVRLRRNFEKQIFIRFGAQRVRSALESAVNVVWPFGYVRRTRSFCCLDT